MLLGNFCGHANLKSYLITIFLMKNVLLGHPFIKNSKYYSQLTQRYFLLLSPPKLTTFLPLLTLLTFNYLFYPNHPEAPKHQPSKMPCKLWFLTIETQSIKTQIKIPASKANPSYIFFPNLGPSKPPKKQ